MLGRTYISGPMALTPSGEWLMPREGGYRSSYRSAGKARTGSLGHDSRCGSNRQGRTQAQDVDRCGHRPGKERCPTRMAKNRPWGFPLGFYGRRCLNCSHPPSHVCTFERRGRMSASALVAQSAGHVKHRTTQDRRWDIPTAQGVVGKKEGGLWLEMCSSFPPFSPRRTSHTPLPEVASI